MAANSYDAAGRTIARAQSERGEVVLRERRDEDGPAVLELRVNGVFVMDTRETSTERALAAEALRLVADPRNVLVGGLGLGFTAREVLADVRVERLDVVEIEEALIGWTRDGVIKDFGLLADRRVTVRNADIATAVAETRGPTYDLVLLDVDNGPGYLVYDANAAVYRAPFLAEVRRILNPAGVLVIWSSDEAPDLEATLTATYESVEVHRIPVTLQDRDEHYLLYRAAGQ